MESIDNFTQISVQKAHEIMASGRVTVVDIRDADSFARGHMAHAKNVNDGNIKDFMDSADKKVPLLCYCYHGVSSQRAAGFFADQGFKQVYSMIGGWEEWESNYG
jgi:thiosulfate sulfurtransferase